MDSVLKEALDKAAQGVADGEVKVRAANEYLDNYEAMVASIPEMLFSQNVPKDRARFEARILAACFVLGTGPGTADKLARIVGAVSFPATLTEKKLAHELLIEGTALMKEMETVTGVSNASLSPLELVLLLALREMRDVIAPQLGALMPAFVFNKDQEKYEALHLAAMAQE